MSNLYEKIMELCKSQGVSGARMCADLGLSRGVLTELKSGRTKTLSVPTMQKIAQYFSVPLEQLLSNEPEELTPVEEIQNELFKKRKLLFDLSGKATEEDLDMFIKILNKIIGENE